MANNEPPKKRARLDTSTPSTPDTETVAFAWGNIISHSPISPPPLSRARNPPFNSIPSPFQLTHIQDLPAGNNVDTVTLREILGDPLIKENWQFNFLFDVDFVMKHVDPDVRDTIVTKIVHGFHDRGSTARLGLEEAAKRWPNVQLLATYVPNYGTHHSKMMILIRHDDHAQVIIHTANMISQDWTNMCQAVWRSPLLPLSSKNTNSNNPNAPTGSGERFKQDLLGYLGAYKDKYKDPLRPLISQLENHDFSSIRAAIVASIPGKQQVTGPSSTSQRLWGWPGLKEVLSTIPSTNPTYKPQINVQVSSIATAPDKWLDGFSDVLATAKPGQGLQSAPKKPTVKVIFPTPDEIRRSLDGYQSGASIHMKLDSTAQKQQLRYMRPSLCTWAGDGRTSTAGVREAGRRRAAPHIKTFIKFTDTQCKSIDWAMVTSANLSKQAWGEMANKEGNVTIRSYEIGVLVAPEWYTEDGKKAVMVPVFKKDIPENGVEGAEKVVGVRMPYDLPVVPYTEDEEPWCAERRHMEPDWKGVVWGSYTPRV